MDDEAYEKVKQTAARRVDEWFTDDPWGFWRDKAREILKQCEAYECGQSTFHPILRCTGTPTKGKANLAEFTEGQEDERLLSYYATCIILHDTAGQGYLSMAAKIWPGYEEPKLLRAVQGHVESCRVYGQPGTLWNLASLAFHPTYGDKTDFIQAALRAVEEDLPMAAMRRMQSHPHMGQLFEELDEIEQGFYAVVLSATTPHRTCGELKRYRQLVLDNAELWTYPALEQQLRHMNWRLMKRFADAAMEVRHHFYRCHLPEVLILAEDHLIVRSDFLRLEQWFLDADRIISARLPESEGTQPVIAQIGNVQEKQAETAAIEGAPKVMHAHIHHSADFHSVRWYGQNFTFTHQQAAVVTLLWQAWENGTPDLGQEHLLERSGSESGRLRDVFKESQGMHPAWGEMVVESRRGVYRLQERKENV